MRSGQARMYTSPNIHKQVDDYDSGDELFDGIDPDQLVHHQLCSTGGTKRSTEGEEIGSPTQSKRQCLQDGNSSSPVVISHVSTPTLTEEGVSFRMRVAESILNQTFGFQTFRHEQRGVIQAILSGNNALAIFPTGAGKSLCYQIPAIAFEQLDLEDGSRAPNEHGITIVVSPLIALMKDQVDALKRRGLPAECIDSTKTWEQQQQINAALREGKLRILYCAPERLNNEGFVANMQHVRGGVRLVAVDEAHCVSEWGHSFRPEYLKVARFVDEIKAERVVCLTATATQKVAEDICGAFGIRTEAVFRTSSYRPNLNLHVRAAHSKQDKHPLLFELLRSSPGPTLVYVTFQQQAVELAADLRRQNLNAEPFHAGLKVEVKTKVQGDFLANRVRIVVATIAFGMGIDKPDIRNVVHYDLPSTIEEYCQQVGRAGRDGNTSNCVFYICPDDWYSRENFARGDLPSRNSLESLMLDIFDADNTSKPAGDTFKKSHYVQSRAFDIRTTPLSIIYAALELDFGLIRAVTPEYSEYKFEPTAKYFVWAKTERSREGKAIAANATKKKKFYYVDVKDIVSRMNIHRADLCRKLDDMHNTGIIELKAGGVEQKYRVMKLLPQSDEEIEVLVDSLHKALSQREEYALQRVKQVEDLFTGDQCLARALTENFGMGLPDGRAKCGHCTHCLTGARTVMPPRLPKVANTADVMNILTACDVRDDPRFLARVAFGIKSPRVTQLKLDKHAVFGTLAEHDFESLMREFTRACDTSTA